MPQIQSNESPTVPQAWLRIGSSALRINGMPGYSFRGRGTVLGAGTGVLATVLNAERVSSVVVAPQRYRKEPETKKQHSRKQN